jgi:uncharacterized protein (UPF0332 family)
MSVDFGSFAGFASPLVTSESEIDWRMSTGRTYYAGYHRALLSTKFCPDNSHLGMGSHERVTDQFMKQGTIQGRSIAYVMIGMKKLRHIADYAIEQDFSQPDAVNQLSQYKVLVAKLNEFDAQFGEKTA